VNVLIPLLVICVLATLSHGGAYFMGRASLDQQRLDDAIAYADEIVARQGVADTLAADLETERAKRIPKNRTITREVIRYVELHPDRRCTLDPAWRLLHDAAATGEPADTARVVTGAADPVEDTAALESVAGNYEQCRDYIAQLEGWQRWWDEVKP
jgi:hypothetical protein